MSAVIEVDRLTRRFGAFEAVAGISFDVAEGELFGFLGPNGAGKTTTIHMLCTLLKPTSGHTTIAGHDVVRERPAVRRSIGLVFQDLALDEYLTAEQNMMLHGLAYGMPREERISRTRELLTLVELWDRRRSPVRTFSGGMKRRLELARGLLHRPRVLFLDESTLGLDPQSRRLVWDHIAQLRRQEQLTVFMTTHYMDEAEYCDHITIIDRGSFVSLDTPEALKNMLGGDIVTLRTVDPMRVAEELAQRFGVTPRITPDGVVCSVPHGEQFLAQIVGTLAQPLTSIGLHRPTLDDVFLHMTGREIRDHDASSREAMRASPMMQHRR